MVCVVCQGDVEPGAQVFANDWERTRQRFPCCGTGCAAAFDQDLHWMPGEQPAAASDQDEHRLVSIARRRLLDGDDPSVTTHDLLVAGVPPHVTRAVLDGALMGADRSAKENRRGWWMLLLTGRGWFKNEKREVSAVELAYASLDEWRLRVKRWEQNRERAASPPLR